jgi:hypothetical protein
MSTLKTLAIALCLVLAGTVLLPLARASEWDQVTEFYFSQPVQLPGTVLPPGTYWFVLLKDYPTRNTVEVFNANWSKLDATELTIPTYRQAVSNRTEVCFAERPHSQPEALLKGYFPGMLTGHEFVYSHKREVALRHDVKQTMKLPAITPALSVRGS